MSTKHTPGPWTVQVETKALYNTQKNESFLVPEYFVRAETAPVCRLQMSNASDAALISAAPEMLKALEAALSCIDQHTDDLILGPIIEQAKAAIKKARGE